MRVLMIAVIVGLCGCTSAPVEESAFDEIQRISSERKQQQKSLAKANATVSCVLRRKTIVYPDGVTSAQARRDCDWSPGGINLRGRIKKVKEGSPVILSDRHQH